MEDAYSPFKIVRHLDVIRGIRDGRPVRPTHVQLIISDLCNQSCNFCAYRSPDYSSSQLFYEIKPQTNGNGGLRRDTDHPERNYNPNRMIPVEKVLEILDDCQEMGVSGIQLTGGGEPTVHPHFMNIAAVTVVEHKLALALVSNGVQIGKRLHRDPRFNELFSRVAWTRISIDAGYAETYAKIRNVGFDHFEAAWEAVRELRRASDLSNLPRKPVVGVGFVVTPDNWMEVGEAARLAKEAGAHNIRISAQFSTQDEALFLGFHLECAMLCRTADRLFTDDTFKVYNRFSEKLDDLKQKRPDYDRCGYQKVTTYVGGDLNVYRCCVTAYNPSGLVGSLKEQRFKDLWMSQVRADDMEAFNARACDRCQFNGINRFLDYALRSEEPQHREFP